MRKNAFSLIELSIVILIIGILVAGVTQSSRLVSAMKVSTARALTNSSAVNSIKGVTLWFDSTAEKAFGTSELDDSAAVSNWYSLNPQKSAQFITTQATTARQPKYVQNGIGNLPVVEFDGDDCLVRANTLGGDIFSARESSFFIVQKYGAAAAGATSTIGFFTDGTSRYNVYLPHTAGQIYIDLQEGACCTARANAATPTNFYRTPHIVSVTRQQDTVATNDTITVRIDGASFATDSDNTAPSPTALNDNFYIGCSTVGAVGSYLGQVGELIFFDRYLKPEERSEVEKYLAKKWGIKI